MSRGRSMADGAIDKTRPSPDARVAIRPRQAGMTAGGCGEAMRSERLASGEDGGRGGAVQPDREATIEEIEERFASGGAGPRDGPATPDGPNALVAPGASRDMLLDYASNSPPGRPEMSDNRPGVPSRTRRSTRSSPSAPGPKADASAPRPPGPSSGPAPCGTGRPSTSSRTTSAASESAPLRSPESRKEADGKFRPKRLGDAEALRIWGFQAARKIRPGQRALAATGGAAAG